MIFHQPFNSLSANNYNANFYESQGFDFHFHRSFEIFYIIKGSVTCTVNQTEKNLQAGEFGLCLPNEIHALKPNPGSLYWVCVFSADYVRAFSKQIDGKVGSDFRFPCSDSIRTFVQENLMTEELPPLYLLKSCLYALCNEYLNAVTLTEKPAEKAQTMAIIIDYISHHHQGSIKLSDIARLLGYDYHYVSRYFHKVFSMPFNDFVNLYRLETATKLMEETDKNLTEIALESGFQSVRTFNEVFRKHFGTNPSGYLRKTVPK